MKSDKQTCGLRCVLGKRGCEGIKKPGYKTLAAGLKENEEKVQVADGIRRLDALSRYRAEGDTATLKTLNFQGENSHL